MASHVCDTWQAMCVNMHGTFGHYIRAFIHGVSRISPWEQQGGEKGREGEGGGREKRKGGKVKRKGGKERRKGGKEKKKKEEKRRRKGRKRGKRKRKRKECLAVRRPRLQRTRNCAMRVRFPPTLVILRLGAV